MTLPALPELSNSVDELTALRSDIVALYQWIADYTSIHAQVVGEAINPNGGQGGDRSMVIDTTPSSIIYTPGSSLSVDNTLFGHIDISFVVPSRAIGVLVMYRENGVVNFKTSFAQASPWRLPNLKVGVVYNVKLVGISANGQLGIESSVEDVTIPTTLLDVTIPGSVVATAGYQVVVVTWALPISGVLLEFEVDVADDSAFTTNLVTYNVDVNYFVHVVGSIGTLRYYRVRSVASSFTKSGYSSTVSATTLNVPNDSITYAKVQNVTASRLLGRDTGLGDVEEISLHAALEISSGVLRNVANTGWAISNVVTDKVYDADATTLAEIADVLGSLIAVLIAKNILSA